MIARSERLRNVRSPNSERSSVSSLASALLCGVRLWKTITALTQESSMYVVFNRNTHKRLRDGKGQETFKTESLAKRALTNAAKKQKEFDATAWKIDTYESWAEQDTEIEV